MGRLREMFVRYDQFTQGSILFKVYVHVSMIGWVASVPAYFIGIKSAGQKAEEKVMKLKTEYDPRLDVMNTRVVEVEEMMATEITSREMLSKKVDGGLIQLNRRLSSVERKPFSVEVSSALLAELARSSERKK